MKMLDMSSDMEYTLNRIHNYLEVMHGTKTAKEIIVTYLDETEFYIFCKYTHNHTTIILQYDKLEDRIKIVRQSSSYEVTI